MMPPRGDEQAGAAVLRRLRDFRVLYDVRSEEETQLRRRPLRPSAPALVAWRLLLPELFGDVFVERSAIGAWIDDDTIDDIARRSTDIVGEGHAHSAEQ